jgi:hypothetical protein
MKKAFITAILFSSLSVSLFAEDGGKKGAPANNSVSYGVLKQFNYEFKAAENIVWTLNESGQKADFTLNGVKMTAYYNINGEYVGVTHKTELSSVPLQAQKEIAATYKDYQVTDVIELEPKKLITASSLSDISFKNENALYFVDLKSNNDEILVRVAPNADVYFFKQIK